MSGKVMQFYYDPQFSVMMMLMFNVIGPHRRRRENILGVGRRSWKVQRSTFAVWEVVWAAPRGKACHVLLMQLLERQSALPGLALPQHKLLVLLFVPARSWGWAFSQLFFIIHLICGDHWELITATTESFSVLKSTLCQQLCNWR